MDGTTTKVDFYKLSFAVTLLVAVVSLSGCVGTAAQMLYFIKGDKVKAEFAGLKNRRVVVVCETDASSYGPNPLTESIAQMLSAQLKQNVKNIELVSPDAVENWKDQNGWQAINYVELGQGIEADYVVAVEISGYSIHEGQTMFKGRSTVRTQVLDIKNNGEVAFVYGPELLEFPKTHARPAIGTTEAEFERAYLTKMVQQISWLFYDHERLDSFAQDAWMYD